MPAVPWRKGLGPGGDGESSDGTEEEDDDEDSDSQLSGGAAAASPAGRCRGLSGCCSPKAPAGGAEEGKPMRFSEVGLLEGTMSHDHAPHVTDEVFNAASHLMGGMLSTLGTAVLVTGASAHGNPWAIVAFSLYGASLMLLFFASFAHHAIRGSPRLMAFLRLMDYVAIYFLIPGTMTPVCLVCMHRQWVGWVFFGASWGLAILGATLQLLCKGPLELPMWASMTMYVTLGWFGAFLAIPAYECIGFTGAMLLLLGGLAYTGGGAIFTLQCPNPVPGKFGFHEIWHIFVLMGAGLHYAAIFFCIWPKMAAYGQ